MLPIQAEKAAFRVARTRLDYAINSIHRLADERDFFEDVFGNKLPAVRVAKAEKPFSPADKQIKHTSTSFPGIRADRFRMAIAVEEFYAEAGRSQD